MSMFYADKRLMELEQRFAWDDALNYLDDLYLQSPSVNILNTIIGCAWYYFIEGSVEDGSYKLDSCKTGMEVWKKYLDIGSTLYSENSYFNFISGYTLSLHGFFLDVEYRGRYEEKGLVLMRKCLKLSEDLSIQKIAENFLKNQKSKKRIFLQNGKSICARLFCGELLIDKYFFEIYSSNGYQGKTKKILSVLGFLIREYNLQFKFQTFEKCHNFYGPMDTYSFYNEFGCLTLHNAVQRGEWAIYIADKLSKNQYELMKREICQSDYMTKSYWTLNGWLKGLAQVIKTQIDKSGNLFEIPIKK